MVNVIIPVYNSSEVLCDALRSLENQTKKMFCVTVVDDCSTEDIKSICELFSNNLHIKYLKTEINSGPGIARQTGLEWAFKKNYEYIMFLDADDILYPRAIEVLSREIQRTSAEFIITPIWVEKKFDPGYLIPLNKVITWMHGKIYRASFLKQHNINFSKKIKYNEDGAFNTLIYNYATQIYGLDEVVYLWRDYKNSITRKDGAEFFYQCYPDFLIGQCESLQQLINDNSFKMVTNNLANLYNNYQKINYRNDLIEDRANIDNTLLSLLSNNDIFNNTLKDLNERKKLISLLQSGDYNEMKQTFLYKETFYEWYKRLCTNWNEVLNENYIN